MGKLAVLYIDRSNAGIRTPSPWINHPPFSSTGTVTMSPFDLPAAEQPSGKDETIKFRAVVDRTILEVFGNDSLVSGTNTFFFSNDGGMRYPAICFCLSP